MDVNFKGIMLTYHLQSLKMIMLFMINYYILTIVHLSTAQSQFQSVRLNPKLNHKS